MSSSIHARFARYALMTAEELGLNAEQLDMVRRGGLMHDIGKLAIPEAILFKPDRLTDQEYEIIKEHVTIGSELLDDFDTLKSVALSVRHHHERWDGNGYPDGLEAEEIPLEARILALGRLRGSHGVRPPVPHRHGRRRDSSGGQVAIGASSSIQTSWMPSAA